MQAIIVAGGRGERLKPITDFIPKPMVEVKGKPVLEHIINQFRESRITDLILALCYLPTIITDYFGDGKNFGVQIRYIYEDPQKPMGSAGAIRAAKDMVDGDFIVTYADILRKLDIADMIRNHIKSMPTATINVYKRIGKDPKSMIRFDLSNRVTEFIERPLPEDVAGEFVWTNGSFYIFNKKVFDHLGTSEKMDFGKDVFPAILKNGEIIRAYCTDSYFVDIGSPEKLDMANNTFSL